jgi:uncharacterized RDD family membrane protein YckC
VAKTVDITTTQNVTIEYELAPMRERAMAWLLDAFMLSMAYFILSLIFAALLHSIIGDTWSVVFVVFYLVFFLGYFVLTEMLNNGRTVGKMAMSIKVIRLDGKDPEWGDVILRAILQSVDIMTTVGLIGTLLIKTTYKGQRLGDMAAGTTVIKLPLMTGRFSLRDIQNIASIENYQPVYPQVRRFTEKDMIFIKTALSRYHQYPNDAHRVVVEHLVEHVLPILEIEQRPVNNIEFLRTLLRDYIVLTR